MPMDLASIQEIADETETEQFVIELYQSLDNFPFSNKRMPRPAFLRAQTIEQSQTRIHIKKTSSDSQENKPPAPYRHSKTIPNFFGAALGLSPIDGFPILSPTKPAPVRRIDLNVFQKLDSARDPAERAFCVETLKNFEFFGKSYEDMVTEAKKTVITKSFDEYITECSKLLQFRKYPKGELVFHKGDVGSKMYLILDGTASVFVPKSYDEQEADREI